MTKLVTGASNEWYTPSKYIELAREVMGRIDLDPASCEFANLTVKADHYYTKEDNGLMHPWFGRIWLNPPYGKTPMGGASNLETFTRRLVEQYQIGHVKEAILLIPVNTATSWFPILWQFPICFPDFRVRFQNENGPSDGASFGTCFVYLGNNEEKFIEVFSKIGHFPRNFASSKAIPLSGELWAGSAGVA